MNIPTAYEFSYIHRCKTYKKSFAMSIYCFHLSFPVRVSPVKGVNKNLKTQVGAV